MDFKKMWKRFFTLDRHHAEGFTLVELIVVIAILAILGGVAVPAYSGYIDRTNKAADQTLIRDVKLALELYAYSNPNSVTAIGVVLNQEGTAPVAQGNATQVQEALTAAFGDPNSIGLKYDGWKGDSSSASYGESSYYGKESELIGTVDNLTTALGKVVEDNAGYSNLIGDKFKDFLTDKNVSTSNGKAVGNAAVLYVAQNVQGNKSAIANAVNVGISKGYSTAGDIVDNIYNELLKTEIGDAAALATVYAIAEGFAQHSNQTDKFKPDFSAVTGADAALDAFTALANSFNGLDIIGIDDYIANGQGNKDLIGYMDMMETIHSNESIVSGNLASDTCFTDGTVESMLKGHAQMAGLGVTTGDGQVAVIVYIDGDGVIRSHVTPANWNK